MKFLTGLLLTLAVLTPAPLLAAPAFTPNTVAERLIAAAKAQGLADDPQWRKLLHYKPGRGGARSDILSPDFFLSSVGARDAQAELDATLAALASSEGLTGDDHAQCRFPARTAWLRARLASAADLPRAACPTFQAWRQDGAISSVSLIFVAGNLRNPASFYGHILLKFGDEDSLETGGLLDTSLNYGAEVPEGENGLMYIARGLFGFYESKFSNVKFYNQTHNYTQVQLRDIWHYDLDLSRDKVDFLLAHSWELMAKDNRYFFLSKNCAYRMAELLEMVLDEPLADTGKPWATPRDVFVKLAGMRVDGRDLVKGVRPLTSLQGRMRQGYEALPKADRAIVRSYVSAPPADPQAALALVSPDEDRRARIEEVLIDYFTFLQVKAKAADAQASAVERRDELLLARLSLPARAVPPLEAPRPSPDLGQRSSLVALGATYNSRLGESAELRFRGAYNDFLSYAPGVAANTELSMIDLRLDLSRDGLDLKSFEALRITTLNVSETGLPQDGGLAWRLRLGAERRDLSCRDCTVAFAEGGIGKGWENEGAAAYVFMNARAQGGHDQGVNLLAGPAAGLLIGPGAAWRGNLEAGLMKALDEAQDAQPYARLEIRFGPDPRWDIRVRGDYQRLETGEASEFGLRFSRYW